MEYFSAKQWSTYCTRDEPWKHYTEEARYKRPCVVWFHLHELSRIGQFIEIESRLMVARGLSWGGMGYSDCLMGTGFPFSSVQSLSHVRLFVTPWIPAHPSSLSITNSRSLLKLMSIESVMPSSHLILCCSLLLLPPTPPSIGVFSNESTLRMRWPNYWSFSFSISPFKEYSGLISFRMDWLDLLVVQRTFKSLLQDHSSETSIFRHSAFLIVQLSHPYMTTGKTIALTRRTLLAK